MKKTSFLFIAYVFPPIPYAGTYRTMRLCNGLAERGHPVHVISIQPGEGIHQDASLTDLLHPDVHVYRTRTVDPWIAYRRDILPRRTLRFIRPVVSRIVETVSTPDHMVGWIPFAIKRGRKTIRDHGIDVIYTTSPPHSEQVVGWSLKRTCGIPWVADLRDPITENTIYDQQNIPWRQRIVDVKLEKAIVKRADAILLNTEHSREMMEEKYPDCGTFHTLRNFFDPKEFRRDHGLYAEFTLSHVGSIYAHRNPEVLFKAYSQLLKLPEIDADRVRVNFIGLNDDRVEKFARQYGLTEQVTVKGLVSHSEALEVMKRSHLLLLIKGFGKKGLAQIPGKLYEYIGSGNKILYVGPKDSECAQIIRDLAVGQIAGEDVDELVQILKQGYTDFREGRWGVTHPPMWERLQPFSVGQAVERLLGLTEEITAKTA